ncbi:MAG: hydantoinase B/oxoprolinase family protein [Acidimicrobiales bacterium]
MTAAGDAGGRWEFWIDRGGTFTDVVAIAPDRTVQSRKVLSEHPNRSTDAAIAAIRDVLGVPEPEPLPLGTIAAVKMGTTVATNALLERQGEPTALVITRGFRDALRIGTQARPDLFALDIVVPDVVYSTVVEVDERVAADGTVLVPLDVDAARAALAAAAVDGCTAAAIVCLHGYRYPDHEARLAELAHEVGFAQVSVSHRVDPLMKLVPRGDTTTVDAYLSPVLRRYVDQVAAQLPADCRLTFMQSSGGRTDAHRFSGKDALLSGPAGGVVGMARTAGAAGFDRLIGFDMGGTSTDVSHLAGEYERVVESEVAGVRVRAAMLDIHTVAAGGGSILHFDGARFRVGPDSAGADPGPACYGNGGPLTVTDANVVLGRLRPEYFPKVFGPGGDASLDADAARRGFAELAAEVSAATGEAWTFERLAEGFVTIAVDNMANAIRRISVQRGHDVGDHTLVSFGGAGGQHACAVADRLGIPRVFVHPQAGVLSAVGIGLAEIRHVAGRAVEIALDDAGEALAAVFAALEAEVGSELVSRGVAPGTARLVRRLSVRAAGSDTALVVDASEAADVRSAFVAAHRSRFGFVDDDRSLVVEAAQVEGIGPTPQLDLAGPAAQASSGAGDRRMHELVVAGSARPAPFVDRASWAAGSRVEGPAVIVETNATTVVDPGWQATMTAAGDLVIERITPRPGAGGVGTAVDPVQLEIFDNLFMNVAEQMGVVLAQTAASVNIKERLDFSCAIFGPDGDLVANAPHIPVHLGSMGDAVKAVIASRSARASGDAAASSGHGMAPGEVYVTNAPYRGGTHLPDVTVVTPVFADALSGTALTSEAQSAEPGVTSGGGPTRDRPIFYVAARGHHADIGGITPGSAPAHSTSVEDEGVLLDDHLLVADGRFLTDELRAVLAGGRHPARNPDQNIADLRAQVAACEKGIAELGRVVAHYGLDVVHAYMGHVEANAEASVRRLLRGLSDGAFTCATDDGSQVSVAIRVDRDAGSAVIDFTGTSGPHPGNFNAPRAVCHAAVRYVLRLLVGDPIPLNAGAMAPVELIIPDPSLISPRYPAAVVAGNVETSQLIVDTLLGAFGVAGASQGTMNNVLFGNDRHQYYETVCGGAGATATADGASAVHTHMTNSRLTDPEVLEWRFPVRVEEFSIRRGSGGEGAHRGGDGVVRRLRFDEAMEVNILSSRRVVAPYGTSGGSPGAVGINLVLRADGSTEQLAGVASVRVERGDAIEIATPGGGGHGATRPV